MMMTVIIKYANLTRIKLFMEICAFPFGTLLPLHCQAEHSGTCVQLGDFGEGQVCEAVCVHCVYVVHWKIRHNIAHIGIFVTFNGEHNAKQISLAIIPDRMRQKECRNRDKKANGCWQGLQ